MTRRDVWPLFAFLLTGPITAVVYILFAIGFTVHHALPENRQWIWKYTYGLTFAVVDMAYNLVVGTIMFGWPRLELFTARITRLRGDGCKFCGFLCDALSIFDPDHCR